MDIQFKQKDEKVYDITIEMEDENEEKFEKKLSIKDFEKDIFIFDFKFDKNRVGYRIKNLQNHILLL